MRLHSVFCDGGFIAPLFKQEQIIAAVSRDIILFSGQSAERYGMDFSFPLSGVEGGDAKASLTETTQRGSGKDTRRFGDLA